MVRARVGLGKMLDPPKLRKLRREGEVWIATGHDEKRHDETRLSYAKRCADGQGWTGRNMARKTSARVRVDQG